MRCVRRVRRVGRVVETGGAVFDQKRYEGGGGVAGGSRGVEGRAGSERAGSRAHQSVGLPLAM